MANVRFFRDETIDSRFIARFIQAPYDERRGVLRMLHAAHEGLEQAELEVVPAQQSGEPSMHIEQPPINLMERLQNALAANPQLGDELPTDAESAYDALEQQAEQVLATGQE